jgi:elongation factor P hydroxylase
VFANNRRKSKVFHDIGSDWYRLEAFRAINQAVGRVIRHKDDFGSILFLDKRFGEETVIKDLSDWVQVSAKTSDGIGLKFNGHMDGLRKFFGSSVTDDLRQIKMRKDRHDIEVRQQRSKLQAVDTNGYPIMVTKSASLTGAKPKKIIMSRKLTSAASQVLNYRATSIVIRLKQRLDKGDMLKLRGALKSYKETESLSDLLNVLEQLFLELKLNANDLADFKEYVRSKDATVFDNFLKKLSLN